MLVYIAVILAMLSVLVFPLVFPLAVLAKYVGEKKWPSRLTIAIIAGVQALSTIAMIALVKFMLWASQL